jgi:hypothetical protein
MEEEATKYTLFKNNDVLKKKKKSTKWFFESAPVTLHLFRHSGDNLFSATFSPCCKE